MINMLFSHARVAFKYGLKSLNLSSEDEILVPDFICDAILQPLRDLKISYIFYSLNDDLSPSWDSVTSQITKNTRGIMMIHYFGHPQNIEEFKIFCEANDLILIEDNAHGFGGTLSGKKLGTSGDIGFNSLRKNLNLPSGGQLLIANGKEYEISKALELLPRFQVSRFRKLLMFFKLKYFLKSNLRFFFKKQPRYWMPFEFNEAKVDDNRIDLYSEKALKTINYENIYKKRRDLYRIWEKFALTKGVTPVFSNLNEGVVPLVFPAYVSSKSERLGWFNWGWEKRYNIHSWPTLPKLVIQENRPGFMQWEKMICFPIDLDMDADLLEKQLSKF